MRRQLRAQTAHVAKLARAFDEQGQMNGGGWVRDGGASTAAPERGSGRQAGHGCDYRSGVHVLHTLLQIGALTVPFMSCERLFLSHGAQPEDRLTLRKIMCDRKHKGRGRCDACRHIAYMRQESFLLRRRPTITLSALRAAWQAN